MIKMVAFDLDGTIADTILFCIEAFRKAVEPYAERPLNEREIINVFGLNEIGMIKSVLNSHHEEAIRDFYFWYEKLHVKCLNPYNGIQDIFSYLNSRNVKVALITGKGTESCNITLSKFGMMNEFCDIKTGNEDKPNKADSISRLLTKHNLKTDEFIYIGDAVSDVLEARKAGVICLSAAWGENADVKELERINYQNIMYTIKQLKEFFRDNLGDKNNV